MLLVIKISIKKALIKHYLISGYSGKWRDETGYQLKIFNNDGFGAGKKFSSSKKTSKTLLLKT